MDPHLGLICWRIVQHFRQRRQHRELLEWFELTGQSVFVRHPQTSNLLQLDFSLWLWLTSSESLASSGVQSLQRNLWSKCSWLEGSFVFQVSIALVISINQTINRSSSDRQSVSQPVMQSSSKVIIHSIEKSICRIERALRRFHSWTYFKESLQLQRTEKFETSKHFKISCQQNF